MQVEAIKKASLRTEQRSELRQAERISAQLAFHPHLDTLTAQETH
jgi:hypothetical protein